MGGDRPDLGWQGRRWVAGPDRRHQELRPRRPGLGDAGRARRRRRRRWSASCRRPRWAAAGGRRAAAGAWARAAPGAGRARGGCAVSAVARRWPTRRCPTPTRSGWPDGGAAFAGSPRRCWRTRAYGDFWSHVLVAEGAVDVAAEPELAVWDVAALVAGRRGGRRADHRARRRARPARRRRGHHQRAAARRGAGRARVGACGSDRLRADPARRHAAAAAGPGARPRGERGQQRGRGGHRGQVEPAVAARRRRTAGCPSRRCPVGSCGAQVQTPQRRAEQLEVRHDHERADVQQPGAAAAPGTRAGRRTRTRRARRAGAPAG